MGVIDDSPDEAVAAESSDSDSTAAWDGAGGDATRVAPDITQATPESGCEPSSLSRSPVAQDYSGRSERNWWISPVFTGCGASGGAASTSQALRLRPTRAATSEPRLPNG